MTASTVTVPRLAHTGRVTFPRLVLSEWTKLRSVRSTVWSLLVAVIFIIGLSVLVPEVRMHHLRPGERIDNPLEITLGGIQIAQLALGVLGVLVITGEYSTGMIRTTMAAAPRRLPVLWSKLLVYGATVLALTLPAAFIAFFVGHAILQPHHQAVAFGAHGVVRALIGAGLYLTMVGLFGLSLGGRIKQVDGFDYDQFIVPGLIAMAMAQAAYSNNASTIFQGRSDRYIDDVLAAPIHNWQVNVGYLVGGAFRAVIIGVGLAACAIPITGAPVVHPALLIIAVLMLVVGFGALGTIVGIYAETFDHTSFINNIVILPLTFLGGVFYSVSRLGSPWEQLSHVNPLFYVVETIRYGFLGVSDVSPWIAFGVVTAMCLALLAWSQWLFTSGRKLKP